GGTKATGGSSNQGGSSASGGSDGTASGGSGGAPACNGSHPLLDGGVRFCAGGACRLESSDTWFAQGEAARCCEGKFTCFGTDGPTDCSRQHPAVDGSVRFCEPGGCYCASEDTCFPAANAATCCPEAPQCL